MLEVIEIKKIISNSSSKLIKAKCNDNLDWVIRLRRKGDNSNIFLSSKRLFSSYLAGKLALELGINTPSVSLVNVNREFYSSLNSNKEWFDINCKIGVASEYIELIRPENKFNDFDDFISFLKSTPEYNYQINGLNVFYHWIYLDDFKNENLQLDNSDKLFFLDFDMGFKNTGYNDVWIQLPEYASRKIHLIPGKYFEGFASEIEPFEPWFDKLNKLDKNKLYDSIGQLPVCWDVPLNYLNDIISFLFSNRDKFILEFTKAIERLKWKNYKAN